MISVVENSAVKLMHSCKPLMFLMNCSRLSFVSVYTRNISSIYLFQCVGEGFVSERILDSSVPMKMLENSFSTKTFSDLTMHHW